MVVFLVAFVSLDDFVGLESFVGPDNFVGLGSLAGLDKVAGPYKVVGRVSINPLLLEKAFELFLFMLDILYKIEKPLFEYK
ncbi:hypothetical protein PIPA1_23940 [Pelosinus sp. IPA-1]|nr:hypothetical protein PIPA1_23940 [Pelosinus sp. IPA-1]